MTDHDADKVIGRIRNDGGWDRRFRVRYQELDETENRLPDPMRQVANILALFIVALLIFIAPLLWLAILTVAQ